VVYLLSRKNKNTPKNVGIVKVKYKCYCLSLFIISFQALIYFHNRITLDTTDAFSLLLFEFFIHVLRFITQKLTAKIGSVLYTGKKKHPRAYIIALGTPQVKTIALIRD